MSRNFMPCCTRSITGPLPQRKLLQQLLTISLPINHCLFNNISTLKEKIHWLRYRSIMISYDFNFET